MTSRMKRIVSSDAKVDFASNFKNEAIKGDKTAGIVSG